MKIRIIGGCGSGKTYIAQLISAKLGIPHIQTDNLVWNRANNTKYPVEERDRLLAEVLRNEAWIIEGVHYKWGYNSFQEADYILIIRNHRLIQDWRTIKRFVKTRLGLEASNYTQRLNNLFVMLFIWNRNFRREDMKRILELTSVFRHKRYIIKSNREIMNIITQTRM
ncbi:hypothetical protein KIH86_02555 [Paenibacillus sp. HN-1]|uniref:hypothetical protein n=1 Tax=Paenibacillus TaxID=44249 RepID=UPI001CAA2E24|nr:MULTISPECIES: hypothetical protein [Paenibacillus]MBY9080227.1 hypothetical protein [Paenibacillus sp. CGMCC 1.18879]MBY9083114.1 hypothetical protein [Paenibacillus sinensis]